MVFSQEHMDAVHDKGLHNLMVALNREQELHKQTKQERDRLKRALDYADRIIEAYESELRGSYGLPFNLAKRGFCQGSIYKSARKTIERIVRGELTGQ